MFNVLKNAYPKSTEIPGYGDLKAGEKNKVENAWIEGDIPGDDKGPGEAVAGVTKKPAAKRAKKDADDEPPKKRARKAKVCNTPLHLAYSLIDPLVGRRRRRRGREA